MKSRRIGTGRFRARIGDEDLGVSRLEVHLAIEDAVRISKERGGTEVTVFHDIEYGIQADPCPELEEPEPEPEPEDPESEPDPEPEEPPVEEPVLFPNEPQWGDRGVLFLDHDMRTFPLNGEAVPASRAGYIVPRSALPRYSLVDDPDAPHGMGRSLRIHYPEGHQDGVTPGVWNGYDQPGGVHSATPLRSYYIGYYFMLEGPMWEVPPAALKTHYANTSAGSRHRLGGATFGSGVPPRTLVNQFGSFRFWYYEDATSPHGTASVSPGPEVDRWYLQEQLVELASLPTSDVDHIYAARVRTYIDGALIQDTTVPFYANRFFSQFHWAPVWGGNCSAGCPKLKDDYMRIGPVRVSGVPHVPEEIEEPEEPEPDPEEPPPPPIAHSPRLAWGELDPLSGVPELVVSWDPVEGVDGYRIRAGSNDGSWVGGGSVMTTEHDHVGRFPILPGGVEGWLCVETWKWDEAGEHPIYSTARCNQFPTLFQEPHDKFEILNKGGGTIYFTALGDGIEFIVVRWYDGRMFVPVTWPTEDEDLGGHRGWAEVELLEDPGENILRTFIGGEFLEDDQAAIQVSSSDDSVASGYEILYELETDPFLSRIIVARWEPAPEEET